MNREELFNQGRKLFSDSSNIHIIVQNYNPNLKQEDIDSIEELIKIEIDVKIAQFHDWRGDVKMWLYNLKDSFIKGELNA